jgi:hypothetical protein
LTGALGLDAVDEAFREGDRNALRSLLMWFWQQEGHRRQQPRATLIVTCRDSKELAARWLNIASPYEYEPKPFREVEVVINEFSASELVSAATLHVPALAARFEQTYRAREVSPSVLASDQSYRSFEAQLATFLAPEMEVSRVLVPESPSLQAVDTAIFEALRHPTLWHCLLKIDDQMQSRVLDGEEEALAHLATRFLSWFCQKACARGKRTQTGDMMEVLKVIAHHCDPHQSPRFRKKDWTTHASKTPYMNRDRLTTSFRKRSLLA